MIAKFKIYSFSLSLPSKRIIKEICCLSQHQILLISYFLLPLSSSPISKKTACDYDLAWQIIDVVFEESAKNFPIIPAVREILFSFLDFIKVDEKIKKQSSNYNFFKRANASHLLSIVYHHLIGAQRRQQLKYFFSLIGIGDKQ